MGWEGVVLRIDADARVVTVATAVFGKPTVIELRPSQLEPSS
jgi:transcription antitermination factor NusG